MPMTPKAKNFFCHVFRRKMSKEEEEAIAVFKTQENAQDYCAGNLPGVEHSMESPRPCALWNVNYTDLKDAKQIAWTIKESAKFV